MKIEVLDINELDIKDILNDQTIFALSNYWKDYGKQLMCSCKPVCSMTAPHLRKIYNDPERFVLIRIKDYEEYKQENEEVIV